MRDARLVSIRDEMKLALETGGDEGKQRFDDSIHSAVAELIARGLVPEGLEDHLWDSLACMACRRWEELLSNVNIKLPRRLRRPKEPSRKELSDLLTEITTMAEGLHQSCTELYERMARYEVQAAMEADLEAASRGRQQLEKSLALDVVKWHRKARQKVDSDILSLRRISARAAGMKQDHSPAGVRKSAEDHVLSGISQDLLLFWMVCTVDQGWPPPASFGTKSPIVNFARAIFDLFEYPADSRGIVQRLKRAISRDALVWPTAQGVACNSYTPLKFAPDEGSGLDAVRSVWGDTVEWGRVVRMWSAANRIGINER